MLFPFSNRKFLLIGNGPSAVSKKAGKIIDNFDGIVVRFNDYQVKGYEEYVGSRTDIWSTVHPYNKDKNFSMILYLTGLWDEERTGERLSSFKKFYKGTPVFQVDPTSFSEIVTNDSVRKRFGANSSGANLVEILVSTGCDISIYGFDFFKKNAHHYCDTLNFAKRIHQPDNEEAYFRHLMKEGHVTELAKDIESVETEHPCMHLLSQPSANEKAWIRERFPGNIEDIENAEEAYSRTTELLSQDKQVWISGYGSHTELQNLMIQNKISSQSAFTSAVTHHADIVNIPSSQELIQWYHWIGDSLDNKTVLVIGRDPVAAVNCLSDYGVKSIDTYILGDHESHHLKDIKARSYDCVICLEAMPYMLNDAVILYESKRLAREKVIVGYEVCCHEDNIHKPYARKNLLHKIIFGMKFDELWLGDPQCREKVLVIEKRGEDYWDYNINDWTKTIYHNHVCYPILTDKNNHLSQSVLVLYK